VRPGGPKWLPSGAALGAVSLLIAGRRTPIAGGYCPVAYVKMHKAVKGDPNITSEKDGNVYYLAAATWPIQCDRPHIAVARLWRKIASMQLFPPLQTGGT
jgi:hypothetical protein